MRVAVTGASGFVGQHVVAALVARGVDVVAVSRAQRQQGGGVAWVQLDAAATGEAAFRAMGRPDVVVHLAWAGLPNYRSPHHLEQELPRQAALLTGLVDAGLPALVVTGTCYEYGLTEGMLDETSPARPVNAYAAAKEALRRRLFMMPGIDLAWLRLFYLFGPGQAATSLYAQLTAALDRDDTHFPMSPGDQVRDFLAVEEAARIIVQIALVHRGARILNVCSGVPVTVADFVRDRVLARGGQIELDRGVYSYAADEPMAFWGSRARLDRLLAAPRFTPDPTPPAAPASTPPGRPS